jgi:hypothetical protein
VGESRARQRARTLGGSIPGPEGHETAGIARLAAAHRVLPDPPDRAEADCPDRRGDAMRAQLIFRVLVTLAAAAVFVAAGRSQGRASTKASEAASRPVAAAEAARP